MKAQTDGPMKANAVLEMIRAEPGARLQVPNKGYSHERKIAAFLGFTHLDKPEPDLTSDERSELSALVDVVHELVEDHRLYASEQVISLGVAGIDPMEVFDTVIVYTAASASGIPFSEVNLPYGIANVDDFLAWLKWWGKVTYRTRFERGQRGFLCEIAKSCGADPSRNDEFLDYVVELVAAGLIEEKVEPFEDTQKGSKKIYRNLPAATHTLRVL